MNTIEALNKVLANTFAFYIKVHFFHWNVTGPNFYEYHKLLETIYTEVYDSIDNLAENVRMLDARTPCSLKQFSNLSSVDEDENPSDSPDELFEILRHDNETVMLSLEDCYEVAENEGYHGLSNLIQDRLQAHSKHQWMIESTLK